MHELNNKKQFASIMYTCSFIYFYKVNIQDKCIFFSGAFGNILIKWGLLFTLFNQLFVNFLMSQCGIAPCSWMLQCWKSRALNCVV